MGTKILDHKYHNKLACVYYPEAGAIEIKLFGCRIMQIKFPPGIPIEFTFTDSKPTA